MTRSPALASLAAFGLHSNHENREHEGAGRRIGEPSRRHAPTGLTGMIEAALTTAGAAMRPPNPMMTDRRRQRPWVRAMLVDAQVSSMNTRRSGSRSSGAFEPRLAALQDVRPILFTGSRSLFLRVMA